jgi:hypothetical protein
MQPKESPELEFIIKALVMVTARREAVCNLLQRHDLIASKEQLENEALSIFQRDLDAKRDAYISGLNLERMG